MTDLNSAFAPLRDDEVVQSPRAGSGEPWAPTVQVPGGQKLPQRLGQALWLWEQARHPVGTRAERYLAKRGVSLPLGAAGAAVRYDSNHPFAGERVGALVCLVRDIRTNEPRGIHRTALGWDDGKWSVQGKDRLALGPVSGGAIKLTPDEDVTTCLGIGEGLESTLSLREAPEFGPSPVWCLVSAGGIERFPVLAGIEVLWIAVDHDPAGLRAARACAERWQTAGREAFLVTPAAPRTDLNDLIKGQRHA